MLPQQGIHIFLKKMGNFIILSTKLNIQQMTQDFVKTEIFSILNYGK